MKTLGQCRHLCELFELGMVHLLEDLRPERAFLAYREKHQSGSPFPTAYATHGFSLAHLFQTEDLSTEILRRALSSGEALLLADAMNAPQLNVRASVLISGLRSVLAVPLRHPSGLIIGLLYADSRVATGAFGPAQLELAKSLADALIAPLVEVERRMKAEPGGPPSALPFSEVQQQALRLQKESRGAEAVVLLEEWTRGQEQGSDFAMAHGIRGRILEQMGRLDEALEALSLSVWILARTSGSPDERAPLMMNNLAGVHAALLSRRRAEGLLKASRELWKRTEPGKRRSEGLAATCHNLGVLLQTVPDYPSAATWLGEAHQHAVQALGEGHPRTAHILQALEQVRRQLGE